MSRHVRFGSPFGRWFAMGTIDRPKKRNGQRAETTPIEIPAAFLAVLIFRPYGVCSKGVVRDQIRHEPILPKVVSMPGRWQNLAGDGQRSRLLRVGPPDADALRERYFLGCLP